MADFNFVHLYTGGNKRRVAMHFFSNMRTESFGLFYEAEGEFGE